jgi:hypothetical protein
MTRLIEASKNTSSRWTSSPTAPRRQARTNGGAHPERKAASRSERFESGDARRALRIPGKSRKPSRKSCAHAMPRACSRRPGRIAVVFLYAPRRDVDSCFPDRRR